MNDKSDVLSVEECKTIDKCWADGAAQFDIKRLLSTVQTMRDALEEIAAGETGKFLHVDCRECVKRIRWAQEVVGK